MSMFRRTADRVIDDAHNRIADAEMGLMHAYTDADKTRYGQELAEAQRYLARAIAARDAWDKATPAHDEDDEVDYPYVPKTDAEVEQARLRAWQAAINHWTVVGFSYDTARALASVKHGKDADVRAWARAIMLRRTNLREEDML